MYYYTCEPNLDSMLSCIFDAWSSKRGHQNIKLLLEPVSQLTLFDEYIHVDADADKVNRVIDAVNRKISPSFFHSLSYISMAYEEDVLDIMYRCMILGFHHGPYALQMVQYGDVMRFQEIRKRVSNEVHHFREFMRFNQVGDAYIAHFEPKSRVCVALGPFFEDRMPSEHFMIIDDVHKEAVVHPKDNHFYMYKLTDDELERLKETENVNDEFTDMWKLFFNTIAIKERYNPKCQNTLFPIWKRKHAVEFN